MMECETKRRAALLKHAFANILFCWNINISNKVNNWEELHNLRFVIDVW